MLACSLLCGCAPTPERTYLRSLDRGAKGCPALDDGLSEISRDSTYGFSKNNPVKVSGGPRNERAYLGMLTGPDGRAITDFYREGSVDGKEAILDMYTLVVEGDTLPKPLYIDMYNCDDPKAPFGFGIKGMAKTPSGDLGATGKGTP